MEHLQKRDPLKLLSLAELAIVEIGSALDNEAYLALARVCADRPGCVKSSFRVGFAEALTEEWPVSIEL